MTAAEIRETLDSFDLGRWRLAWDAYLAGPRLVPAPAVVADPTDAADAVLAHEVELAREVCEDAEVDALAFPPMVALPFGLTPEAAPPTPPADAATPPADA